MDGNATCSLKFHKSETYASYCFRECGYCVPHLLLVSCELGPGYPQPGSELRDVLLLCLPLWAEEVGVQEPTSLTQAGPGSARFTLDRADAGLRAHVFPLPSTWFQPVHLGGYWCVFKSAASRRPHQDLLRPFRKPPKDVAGVTLASPLGVFLSLGSVLGEGEPESWEFAAPDQAVTRACGYTTAAGLSMGPPKGYSTG